MQTNSNHSSRKEETSRQPDPITRSFADEHTGVIDVYTDGNRRIVCLPEELLGLDDINPLMAQIEQTTGTMVNRIAPELRGDRALWCYPIPTNTEALTTFPQGNSGEGLAPTVLSILCQKSEWSLLIPRFGISTGSEEPVIFLDSPKLNEH